MHHVSPEPVRALSAFPVVGLHGLKRSGKDTAAAGLHPDFRRLAFASALKDHLLILNPLLPSGRRLAEAVGEHGWEAAKDDPVDGGEARRLMQVYGTEIIRGTFGATTWTDIVGARIAEIHRDDIAAPIVMTDVRFSSEAEMVRRIGGIVVEIFRPGLDTGDGHASEQRLDPALIDYTVDNDGTIDQLQGALRELVTGLWG